MTWPLALLLLASTTAKASPPEEPEALEARAVRCGEVLTRNTRLTRGLVCPGTPEPALTLAAPGIVLDLGGHTVRRSGPATGDSVGIVAGEESTVRNGTIRGFNSGYVFDNGPVRLHQLALLNNQTAIYHRQGYAEVLITDSRLRGNAVGMRSEFDAANGVVEVRGTQFTGNGTVLFVDDHEVNVSGSTFTSNTNVLYCFYGRVRFRSSTLAWNTSVADLTWNSSAFDNCWELVFDNTVIANNTAFGTPEHPHWEPFDFQLRNSWVINNGGGLRVSTRTLDVRNNLWWANAGGLTVADLPEFEPIPLEGPIQNNRFLSNRGDGLRVLPGSTPTLTRNVCQRNTGWGIHAPTAIDGGGNTARGNSAGGCVGVVCAP
ncbi:right-handed parallel beta-helix repeat-containing protein [Corallococcus aberystwythensis]|uniref:Right-handed parallel beta-helix repeat-containing protein n=1 Tax=Corallococcus aberystwythensis TaxID=2316722 RepID=A0A3A8QC64_9BACT|nr:right-handed parallel beta-helix repeat-containing protein [Corallococcus aberystwythensis]RKH60824.1 right-handed parallel beta-helix repeat-containing protein [Corallococcus aberystwythensis]